MFTAKNRVERDGFLIAYEGETMTDAEAARRGLIDGDADAADGADVFSVGTPPAVVNPPIDDAWAEAAGMSVEDCIALWGSNPSALLEAIVSNLTAGNDPDGGGNDDGANDPDGENATGDSTDAANDPDGANAADGATAGNDPDANAAKPSKEALRKECEARGIKAPKNATIAQLEALLED